MTVRFAQPWLLLFGLAILAWWLTRAKKPAAPFSHVPLLDVPVPPSLRLRLLWLPDVLRAAWLGLLVLALARPQTPVPAAAVYSPGLALELVLDVSGSMAAEEAYGPDGPITRLDQVRAFVHRFLGNEDGSRARDAIGLVAFARYPRVACPLTTSHAVLLGRVDELEVDRLENRTNVGDALAVAVDRLAEATVSERVILLLSDGAHNVEEALPPGEAARIAEALGVRVYTVGVGAQSPMADEPGPDETTLRRVADMTGGRYFRATNAEDLAETARELDSLEPSPATIRGYSRWQDRFRLPLLAALVVWLVELLLRSTWLRVLPEG